MNDDAFEKKLCELTDALQRPDPTPAWKSDILARARREADAVPRERTRSPRWLAGGLGVAWAAIFLMDFTTPREAPPSGRRNMAAVRKVSVPDDPSQGDAWTLLAFHNRMNLSFEFPQ
jgi:hypothetical protein